MLPEKFHCFLINRYCGVKSGMPLKKETANDAVSRCYRIERTIGADLEYFIDGSKKKLDTLLETIDVHKCRFNIAGDTKKGISSIKNAAKLYSCFLQNTSSR